MNLTYNRDTDAAIFLHLGKTAGSTLGNIIDRQYPHDKLYVIGVNADNARFAQLPEDYRTSLQCVRGITYYGIHNFIPKPSVYFTLLRHPVERVISQHFYNQRRRERQGVAMQREPYIWEMLNHEPFQATLQLRMILGGNDMTTALEQPLPPDALEIAKRHLEQHFSVIGLVEHFDKTLALLKHAFGWRGVFYGQRNVAPNRAQRDDIPPRAIELIEQMAAPEIELYEWAQKRFEDTLQAQPQAFWDDLESFQRFNQLYNRVWNGTNAVRKTAAWRTFRRYFWPTWEKPEAQVK